MALKLEIVKSESLVSYLGNEGNTLDVIENPKNPGHFFFQTAKGSFGAISSKLPVNEIDFTKPQDYQICHSREVGHPDGEVVPFLCKASKANVKGTFSL